MEPWMIDLLVFIALPVAIISLVNIVGILSETYQADKEEEARSHSPS